MTKKHLVAASFCLVLGLGACSAGFDKTSSAEDASSSPVVASSPSKSAVTSGVPTQTKSPSGNASSSESAVNDSQDSDADSSPGADEEGALRDELAPDVTTELTCPDGTLNIDGTALSVEIVDDCETVNVTGDISTVLAQGIGTLNLDGTGSTVLMTTVDVVNVSEKSSINTVVWESGNPVVNDLSTSSVVVSEGRLP